MGNIYLTPEESEFLRRTLFAVTPLSPDAHELFATEAADKPDQKSGKDSLGILKQRGYLGVEVKNGTVYLGLPRYLSRPLAEALAIVFARMQPTAGQQIVQAALSTNPEEFPDIYIAIPRRQ